MFFSRTGKKSDFKETDRAVFVGDCLDAIMQQKEEQCADAFRYLDETGIRLPEGPFRLIRFTTRSAIFGGPAADSPAGRLIDAVHDSLPQHYLFTSGGTLYAIVPSDGTADSGPLESACREILQAFPEQVVHVIISHPEEGRQGIFHAANSLRQGADFFLFFGDPPEVCVLDLRMQMEMAAEHQLTADRRLSDRLIEQLDSQQFHPDQAAAQVLAHIRSGCPYSMDALHQRMQTFFVMFINRILDKGFLTREYLNEQGTQARFMRGDTEALFQENLSGIFLELHAYRQQIRTQFDTQLLSEIRTFIQNRIASPDLTVGFLADQFQVNRSQLARMFRAYYGETPSSCIQKYRLEYAILLLESHPEITTEQVALDAGYSDISTMYRAFRREGLESPATFRSHQLARKRETH